MDATRSVNGCARPRASTTSSSRRKRAWRKARVLAIVLGRWTPSPAERDQVAAVFGLTREQIAWGHKTPIQHIYGHGPG